MYHFIYEAGMLLMELYICWILKKEYDYDKAIHERRVARRKKHLEFNHLTTGEGR